jgi:dephospho-CoA kinase
MLKIGITGGIGSGKSTVARVFETLGIPVYYADDAAKRLMQEDPELKKQIIALFGETAFNGEKLNRPWISAQIFGNPEKVNALNALVHPATIKDAHEWMSRQRTPYTLKEAALIFESGSEKELDYVIGVDAPLELRIQRVIERDNTTRDAILQRIKNQLDEAEKMKRCDFIIHNDGNQMVIPQVIALHHQLVELDKSKLTDG